MVEGHGPVRWQIHTDPQSSVSEAEVMCVTM